MELMSVNSSVCSSLKTVFQNRFQPLHQLSPRIRSDDVQTRRSPCGQMGLFVDILERGHGRRSGESWERGKWTVNGNNLSRLLISRTVGEPVSPPPTQTLMALTHEHRTAHLCPRRFFFFSLSL